MAPRMEGLVRRVPVNVPVTADAVTVMTSESPPMAVLAVTIPLTEVSVSSKRRGAVSRPTISSGPTKTTRPIL
jgi:hypothetical protein